MPVIDVPTIHAVTDTQTLAGAGFFERAAALLRAVGSAGALHLRTDGPHGGGTLAGRHVYDLALALAPVASASGAWLVINDRIDIALASGATRVQLRGDSVPLADAVRIAPSLAFGLSVHDRAAAVRGVADGASWLVAGNVFDTATHPSRPGRGANFAREFTDIGVPLIAIGGVHPDHVPALVAAGWHGVAAIRGIWGEPNPAAAALAYLSKLSV